VKGSYYVPIVVDALDRLLPQNYIFVILTTSRHHAQFRVIPVTVASLFLR